MQTNMNHFLFCIVKTKRVKKHWRFDSKSTYLLEILISFVWWVAMVKIKQSVARILDSIDLIGRTCPVMSLLSWESSLWLYNYTSSINCPVILRTSWFDVSFIILLQSFLLCCIFWSSHQPFLVFSYYDQIILHRIL